MKKITLTEKELESYLKRKLQEQQEKGSPFEKMASYLMFSQTQVHIFHLQTGSYAEHKALQGYYEGIDDLADSLIEAYQGEFGILENYMSFDIEKYESGEQVIQFFEMLLGVVNEGREDLPPYLQNIVDTIIELIRQTIYKLKFLK